MPVDATLRCVEPTAASQEAEGIVRRAPDESAEAKTVNTMLGGRRMTYAVAVVALGSGEGSTLSVALTVAIMAAGAVALALAFLAWVVGNEGRTGRLSALLRSIRGGDQR